MAELIFTRKERRELIEDLEREFSINANWEFIDHKIKKVLSDRIEKKINYFLKNEDFIIKLLEEKIKKVLSEYTDKEFSKLYDEFLRDLKKIPWIQVPKK